MPESECSFAESASLKDEVVPEKETYGLAACNIHSYQLFSEYTSPIITLVVGGSQSPSCEQMPVRFSIHASILLPCSTFFRAAFRNDENSGSNMRWAEKVSQEMRMPEDRVEDVGMLVRWLYCDMDRIMIEKGHHEYATSNPAPSLWHPQIDPRVAAYKSWFQNKQTQPAQDLQGLSIQDGTGSKTCGNHITTSSPQAIDQTIPVPFFRMSDHSIASRPPPPVFGPLIRLYLLCIKYDVRQTIRSETIQKIRTIAAEAKCIPSRLDIQHVWNGTVQKGDDLRQVILEQYAGLSRKRFRRAFGKSELIGGPSENMVAQDEWHPEFLRQLLLEVHCGTSHIK